MFSLESDKIFFLVNDLGEEKLEEREVEGVCKISPGSLVCVGFHSFVCSVSYRNGRESLRRYSTSSMHMHSNPAAVRL